MSLIISAVIVAFIAAGVAVARNRSLHRQRRNATIQKITARAAVAHRGRVREHLARNKAAHDMQLAILQLEHSPDFRRAAVFAKQAANINVPLEFRQRQFSRLRPSIVQHLANLLGSDTGEEAAFAGLRELVSSMGMPPYETDYILNEARPRNEPPRAPDDYATQLRKIEADHVERIRAIKETSALDKELREQLVEAEQERFRTQLLDQQGNSISGNS